MNTYNEALQQTVIATLDALANQQAQLESARIAAEYTLYYAQGAELTARDNLDDTQALTVFSQNTNDQSLFNSNQAYNLQASLTQANLDVAASVTNAATAAANVQIASNAIAALAADLGATLNIATASLFGDDSYRKIQDANCFVNEVANNAKAISLGAMNASTRTSEIIAAAVLNQGNTVKTKVNALYSATSATLSKYSDLAISQAQSVAQASKSDRQAEGAMRDADRESLAITGAYANATRHLNMGLCIGVVSGQKINVSFLPLASPLPTFTALPASAILIPPAAPRYYLALVREDAQTMFTVDQAEQLFMQWQGVTAQFCQVTPDQVNPVALAVDAYGAEIVAGVGYVGFLLIEISKEYQRYVNNYSDLLSAPSATFVPATPLPKAQPWRVEQPLPGADQDAAEPWPRLYFKAASIMEAGNAAASQAAASAKLAAAQSGCASQVAAPTIEAAKHTLAAESAANQAARHATREHAQPYLEAGLKAAQAAKAAAQQASEAALLVPAARAAADADRAISMAAAAAAAMAAAAARDVVAVASDSFDLAFRCILVEEGKQPSLGLMTSAENDMKEPVYFNLSIACQVAPSNYVVADLMVLDSAEAMPTAAAAAAATDAAQTPAAADQVGSDSSAAVTPAVAPVSAAANSDNGACNYYVAHFPPTATDNFGNLLRQNTSYQPYILAIVGDDHAAQYTPVLTNQLAPLTT